MIKSLDLRTARLRIRHFVDSDLENCVRFRREVFGLTEDWQTAEAWLAWTIASYRELAQLDQPPYADYAIELSATGEFIGSVGIVPLVVPWGALKGEADDKLLSPEFGLFWGILPGFRRRGFASEAGGALVEFLFEALGARRVVATTAHDNIPSQKTMEKLGMRLYRNPLPEPGWCQVVGVIGNPRALTA